MTRVDYYFNAVDKFEVARKLVSKAFVAGRSVLVAIDEVSMAEQFDAYLWQSSPLTFLPHVLCSHPAAADTPILIGADPIPLARHEILINLSANLPECFSKFDRLLDIVSLDVADKTAGRNRFRLLKESGFNIDIHDLNAVK
jgi:DNA polymerase-3 subunit chi